MIATAKSVKQHTVHEAAALPATLPALPEAAVAQIVRREEKAIAEGLRQADLIGMGISREVQQLFNAISKT